MTVTSKTVLTEGIKLINANDTAELQKLNLNEDNLIVQSHQTVVTLNQNAELFIGNETTLESNTDTNNDNDEPTNINTKVIVEESTTQSLSISKELKLTKDTMTIIHCDINEEGNEEGNLHDINTDDIISQDNVEESNNDHIATDDGPPQELLQTHSKDTKKCNLERDYKRRRWYNFQI
ncbi:uncharacterized protein LOC127283877 isoform X2 [Leptopilina boulardi]|uniref:uncharacterized protein LOC127283877 isoform X2 n=1 Tax=Leptopilina boulardi TaxID=63433 RepID=UPI0021F64CC9|nr:uncharacterized protein LOC127283877 isoform X2 [Leptopilina boulardi]